MLKSLTPVIGQAELQRPHRHPIAHGHVFHAVADLAEETGEYMRDAAYMIAIQRVATACPFCYIMLDDGVKGAGVEEDEVRVADISIHLLEAIEASARVAATEAAAAGVHWTFAPMLDIARDARWGRIMEGAGEDPYLGSMIATARVRGFQGTDLSALDTVAACAKHYAGYGFAEGGRDYNTVDISEQTLRNVVLPPFHAAAEAGVATFMNSFNEIGGVPATASVHLQREILKGEWGFEGFVVSDWGSIGELRAHGVAADLSEAARLAVVAGSDMDMEAQAYVSHLVELVESGEVEEARVDDAVRRILRIKFALGLFDDPYRYFRW